MPKGFFYYHADHQGSITHLTDTSGTIANSYVYDSYGRTLSVAESVPQPYTYTGRERDGESGLYYYRARYYDQSIGRFLSEDPIRFQAGDQNLYRYVISNPINMVDPQGTAPLDFLIKQLFKELSKIFGKESDPTSTGDSDDLSSDPGEFDSDGDGLMDAIDPDSEQCRFNCDPENNPETPKEPDPAKPESGKDPNSPDNPNC